jgi:hypothetical protein
MKKFGQKSLLFIFPILILAFPIDVIISNSLSKTYDNTTGEFEVWNDIYSGDIDCDLAIYGSSRAWVQFNSKILEDSLKLSVYNFGIDGHNFWLQYLRHLEYIKYNKPPKQIIVSVDVFSLGKRNELYNMNQFLPYMLWNTNIYKYTHSYLGYKTLDYFIPILRYAGKQEIMNKAVITFTNNNSEKFRYHGYKGMDSKWTMDFEKAKSKAKNYKIQFDKNTIELFEHFLSECKFKKINVILIYAPEYIEGQKFVSNRNEIIRIYKILANKYKILFLDYSSDKLSYDKNLFYNTLHLNSKGADLFTKKLTFDLKSKTQQ